MNYTEKIKKIENIFKNKKVAILGFGKEGISTYNFIQKYFPQTKLVIADIDEKIAEKYPDLQNNSNITLITGENYLSVLEISDLIIKSPGISLKKQSFYKYNKKITSQTDIFLMLFSEQVIGITGTKGKSTTSSLIFHILQKCSKKSILVGNIGLPPFDMITKINNNTHIVFEMSSHQLQNINTSPHISVLLNIYQEHLDHYNSYSEYQKAKLNIALYQNKNDFFIYNSDNEVLVNIIANQNIKSQKFEYSLSNIKNNGIFIENSIIFSRNKEQIIEIGNENFERKIKGKHNLANILAAIKVCEILKIPHNEIIEAISKFKGLEHRMEYFGTFNGIKFYNDSISTIPEATIAALQTITDTETLILGGFDRGISYSDLAKFLINSNVTNYILLGEAGNRIYDEMKKESNSNSKKFFFAKNMIEVVELVFDVTSKDKSCLLSPAASSYDLFKNFEHRGKLFKEIVQKLAQKTIN